MISRMRAVTSPAFQKVCDLPAGLADQLAGKRMRMITHQPRRLHTLPALCIRCKLCGPRENLGLHRFRPVPYHSSNADLSEPG